MRRSSWFGLLVLVASNLAWAGSVDTSTEQALLAALEDERAAAALYDAVIESQGEVRPFTNIVNAEVRHADHLLVLFEKYGIEIPGNAWAGKEIEVPATRSAACGSAVEAEIANIAMYDELLETVEEPDVREMFTMLRDASRDRHIPAFERCVSSGSGAGAGRGYGSDRGGQGQGYGASRGGQGRGCGAGRGGKGPGGGCGCPGCCWRNQSAEDAGAEKQKED